METRLGHALYEFLRHFHGPAGYVGVFSVLIACGLGLPLPEDVALITGGYLAGIGPFKNGVGSLPLMMLVGLLGILIGDSIIFHAGGHYGDRLLETRLGKHIPAARVDRTRQLFARHGTKMIMVARFLPGVRAVTYFVAGSSHVPYWKFLTYDGIAALVSAPLWVLLGYQAGKHHERVAKMLSASTHVELGILAVAAVGLFGWLGFMLLKKRRGRALERQKLLEASMVEPQMPGQSRAEVPGRAGSA